jgi:glycerol-3-phosphate dehydrogenase
VSPAAPFIRATSLERLRHEEFDVVVIGGGITGAGVALDAASRGLRVALVERDDFAAGTSSRSSKLIHGGLRYLQQREFRLVYEALAERQRLRRNAPHLVRLLPFLIPLFGKEGVVNRSVAKAYNTALWLYDLTGGARIGKLHQRLSVDEALEYMPTLPRDRLVAGFLYWDARSDDARLTLALARTAAAHGAVVANHTAVVGLQRDQAGNTHHVEVEDDGQRFTITTKVVVNAAGVWADKVRALDEGADPHSIRPAKGVHLTLPWEKVRNEIAAVVPVPGDRRSIFVVPWGDRTYVGTTDTDYDGPLDDPLCTAEDVRYLLDGLNASLVSPVTTSDVLGTWAGLRPLVADATSERTADMSRRHRVEASTSGVITVTGGKLTTYRRMAADTVDAVVRRLGHRPRRSLRSRTAKLSLIGATAEPSIPAGLPAPAESVVRHLVDRYGDEATTLAAMIADDRDLAQALVPSLPYTRAEALFAVRYEMARDLFDILDRRTRARLLARDATAAAAADVAELVAPDLGWDEERAAMEVARYREALDREREAAQLPETALDAALGA